MRYPLTRSAALLISAALAGAPAIGAAQTTAPATSSNAATSAPQTGQPPAEPNLAPGPQIARTAEPEVVRKLPDAARPEEIQGQYGFGIATLVVGALAAIAIVVGFILFVTRRSWSAS